MMMENITLNGCEIPEPLCEMHLFTSINPFPKTDYASPDPSLLNKWFYDCNEAKNNSDVTYH